MFCQKSPERAGGGGGDEGDCVFIWWSQINRRHGRRDNDLRRSLRPASATVKRLTLVGWTLTGAHMRP